MTQDAIAHLTCNILIYVHRHPPSSHATMTIDIEPAQKQDGYTTRSIHVGSDPDSITGAVVPGLSVATTFVQDGVDRVRGGHDYSRSSNPTRSLLEAQITALETAPSRNVTHEPESLVFASGSAATAALASWVSLTTKEGGAGGRDGVSGGGGHILAINDVVSFKRLVMLIAVRRHRAIPLASCEKHKLGSDLFRFRKGR